MTSKSYSCVYVNETSMRVRVIDIHDFPTEERRRAARQLPNFKRLGIAWHDVVVARPTLDSDAAVVDDLAQLLDASASITWYDFKSRTGTLAIRQADAVLGAVVNHAPSDVVVVTSTRPADVDSLYSFLGAHVPQGVRVPPLPSQTTVAGAFEWVVHHCACHDKPRPLPPPVCHHTDIALLAARTTDDPFGDGRPLWIKAVVPHPRRSTTVVACMRFGLRDLVDGATWDGATRAERCRMLAAATHWPTPDAPMTMHDLYEHEEGVAAAEDVRTAARALFGATVHVPVPPGSWLSAPLPRHVSVGVSATETSSWLPWTLRSRLDASRLTKPLSTVWVPEEHRIPVVLAERCPLEWTPTGEDAILVCADRVVHAVAVRPVARPKQLRGAASTARVKVREMDARQLHRHAS